MVNAHASEVPAARRHLIKRPRLTRMLDESGARIILLVAPAGYGKTTLAREWLQGKRHVWYRGRPADADVAALAVGVAAAAEELTPAADQRIRERLGVTNDPEREARVLAEIVAEDLISWPEHAWFAFDDYHFATESDASEQFVETLAELTPLRLFVTSRQRPSWALARKVLYGEIELLGSQELAMTDGEVSEVLNRKPHEAPQLFRCATGWPAVVGLAARLRLEELGDDHFPPDLHDFFAEELWASLPTDRQWQLAQLAVLSDIAPHTGRALFGTEADEIIEFGAEQGWLVRESADTMIHPLLRRFLLGRFLNYPQPERNRVVDLLLAALCAREQWDDAMALALELGSERSIPRLLELAIDPLLATGRTPSLQRWVRAAADRRLHHPILSLAEAEVAFRHGDYAQAETLARHAAIEFTDSEWRVRSLNRAGQSAGRLDRADIALELHRKAREEAAQPHSIREAVIGELFASLDLALPESEALLEQLPSESTPVNALRRATVELQVACRLGGVEETMARTTPLLAVVENVEDPLARTSFLYMYAGALGVTARYRDALPNINRLAEEATKYRLDFAIRLASLLRVMSEAGLRNFQFATSLLSDVIALATSDADIYTLTNARAVEARLLAASGSRTVPPLRREMSRLAVAGTYAEYVGSVALAAACAGDLDGARHLSELATDEHVNTETAVLRAWVDAIVGTGSNEADSLARAAFALTVRSGYIDTFVCAYRGCPGLLSAFRGHVELETQVAEILIRAGDFELAEQLRGSPASAEVSKHRLSPREREVYRLMVEGLSNRAIAQRLYIAESTAKVHVRHILDKLGARSRAEAVSKWRDVLGESGL